MENRTEPPAKSMIISFFIIVPISIAVSVVAYLNLHMSWELQIFVSIIVFFIMIWILRIASTFVLALIYRIPLNIDSNHNPEQDRIIELRAKIEEHMRHLGMDETSQSKVKRELLLGERDEEEVLKSLEEEMMKQRRI